MSIEVTFAEKLRPLFKPKRNKIVYGGRGSGKSWGVARALILKCLAEKLLILCTREYQNSLSQSVHRLLSDQIDLLGFAPFFDITKTGITCKLNGSEFIFIGTRKDPAKIKSTEGIDIVWCEEAENMSKTSWEVLIPTIRKPNSEIWVTFNPREASDPTYHNFVATPRDDTLLIEMNWRDNPWFSDVMNEERKFALNGDYDTYNHIWEGKTLERSDAQILWDKVKVQEVKPRPDLGWNGPYYGCDWGFNDPMRLMRVWTFNNDLYIEREVDGVRIDMDNIVQHLIAGDPYCSKYVIRADCSRPETISHCRQNGLPKIVASKKGPGSVDEGILFIRSFRNIIIDPSCKKTIEEARLYKYKVDKLSGDVLPTIVDAHNHSWDAVRYALEPLMPKRQITGAIKTMRKTTPKIRFG